VDGGEEEALLGIAGNDGGTGVAAFEDVFAGVERKAALGGILVAATAGVDEDGTARR